MALIVEDGTGVAGADAYVSVAYVDAYAQAFGKSEWGPLDNAVKEIKIRTATRYADSKYPWPGSPLTTTQGLFFPAEGLYVRNQLIEGVPRQVKDAVSELAIIAITTDLTPSISARAVSERKVKIGDLEKTEKYDDSLNTVDNVFGGVDLILGPILGANSPGGGIRNMRMVRV